MSPFGSGCVQAELTFSAGDVIYVFGDMDEDGFFYVSVISVKFDSQALHPLIKRPSHFEVEFCGKVSVVLKRCGMHTTSTNTYLLKFHS